MPLTARTSSSLVGVKVKLFLPVSFYFVGWCGKTKLDKKDVAKNDEVSSLKVVLRLGFSSRCS